MTDMAIIASCTLSFFFGYILGRADRKKVIHNLEEDLRMARKVINEYVVNGDEEVLPVQQSFWEVENDFKRVDHEDTTD